MRDRQTKEYSLSFSLTWHEHCVPRHLRELDDGHLRPILLLDAGQDVCEVVHGLVVFSRQHFSNPFGV